MPQRPISATISVEPNTPITAQIPAIVDSLLDLYREYTGNPEATLAELFADLTGADGTTPSLRLTGTVLEVQVGAAWQLLGDVGGPPGADGLLRTVPTLDDLSARPGDAARPGIFAERVYQHGGAGQAAYP